MDRLEFEAKVALELGMGMTEPWGKSQYEVMQATLKVAIEMIRSRKRDFYYLNIADDFAAGHAKGVSEGAAAERGRCAEIARNYEIKADYRTIKEQIARAIEGDAK